MVHALEEIQRLLKPNGCLIDIHPVREAPLIKVYRGQRVQFVEPDPGYDYDESIQQAEDALTQSIQRGMFVIDGSDEFDLITYASSVVKLQEYFAKVGAYDDDPKDDAREAQRTAIYARVEEIMQAAGGEAEIAYHERAHITRLNPNVRKEELS